MSELQFQVVRSAGFVLAALLAVTLQRLAPHARLHGSWRTNLGVWAVNVVAMGLVCGACACTVARWAATSGLGLLNAVETPVVLSIAVSVVALDLVSYGWHRANHVIPFLWRFHQVHHSDPSFTVSTGVRFHPGELVLSLPLRLTAVALVGAPVAGVVVFEICFGIANLIEHGDINYPSGFERLAARLLVTPALHRRHHGRQTQQFNTNFGTIFTLWDRFLGTYVESTSDNRVHTGLVEVHEPLTVGRALTWPLMLKPRG